ncbi:MAG: hypothetical protein AAF125_06015, partial [Chloroflexota bacterium]
IPVFVGLLVVVVGGLIGTTSVQAQASDEPFVITITEERAQQAVDIRTYRRDRFDNMRVDMQPGQVVLSGTVNPWFGTSFDGTLTLVPGVENGRVVWNATAGTINGATASASEIDRLNREIGASLRRYAKQTLDPGRVIGVEVTADALFISYARASR